MYIIGVKFKLAGKVYNFIADTEYEIGSKVIVETERGLQLGEVNSAEKDLNSNSQKMKTIIGKATEEDYSKFLKNLKDAKRALEDTKILIKNSNINMNLIDANYTLDRKVLLFNFISDERVDFRNLVKELASKYHTRIELHQIGVRDKAKEIGGIGPCGRSLCCHNHLQNVNSVNITMVKNQNIALNPTKINGACGRLLCCFTYENELYEKNKRGLPKVGEKINFNGREVKVIDVDILNRTYTIKTNENNIEKVSAD